MDRVAAFGVGSTNFRYVAATPDGQFHAVETVDLGGPLADRGLPFAVEDDASAAALDEWHNAAGVGAVCDAVDPALVTLGGGVVTAHPDWVVAGIERHLGEFCFVDRSRIRTTALDDHAGLYGALAACRVGLPDADGTR
jgi:predicted NBD/HSP70 family sugar kinase